MNSNNNDLTIGIVTNGTNKKIDKIKDELQDKLSKKKIDIRIYESVIADAKALDEFSSAVNLIFAIGGDGTLLSVLRSCGKMSVPVIGINAGRKGFLAEISTDEIDFAIDKILNKEYSIEERLLLEAKIFDSEDKLVEEKIIAVNDFNIARHGYARMIRLDIYMNNQLAESFDGDGVLISSPIGSTAYSLSAGGPIILPGIDCILITPVCSHSLHARPMIAPDDVKIKVIPKDLLHDVVTTVDGQHLISIPLKGHIEVAKSDYKAKFIRFRNEDYYTRFWKKIINWSIN
ncbi:MAG: NAD(+)/NADH kinase [Eubacteriales bacterium]